MIWLPTDFVDGRAVWTLDDVRYVEADHDNPEPGQAHYDEVTGVLTLCKTDGRIVQYRDAPMALPTDWPRRHAEWPSPLPTDWPRRHAEWPSQSQGGPDPSFTAGDRPLTEYFSTEDKYYLVAPGYWTRPRPSWLKRLYRWLREMPGP